MKSIQVHDFGPPEVMKLETVPDPKPVPTQVVVRIKAAGVNPVDTYIRSGAYGRKPALPYTPGYDAAGIVESSGKEVKRFAKGDRVYIAGAVSGSYAELALCEEAQVHPLPEGISFQQGAAMGIPYGTAYRALFHCAQARAGETVLVHGASGGVGIAAVQIARARGLTVIGTAGTDKGRDLVLKEGAHHVLDHRKQDYLDQLMKLTGDRGADVILEMLANVNLGKDLKIAAPRGRIVVIGSRGPVEIDARDAMGKNASVIGMTLSAAPPQELVGIHAALVAGLENRTLRPVIGKELPLSDASRAHKEIMEPGAHGKIVLIP